ncbi:MAG: hypothetical protein FWG03_06660 [Clostridiales bacterium]|nr:hypothetical protein [Clostridiales bacterium]
MRHFIMMVAMAGLLALAPGCGAKSESGGAGFSSFLDTLKQLENADRAGGIVGLVQGSVSMLGADSAALDQAEYGFEYLANADVYRKDVIIFGVSGFLDISVESGRISEINYYLAEHADGFGQDETGLLDNVISEYGSPSSIHYHDEPLSDIQKIKDEYSEGDELSHIKYNCLWEDIDGNGHTFSIGKEFAVFQNKNLSYYFFS